MTKLTYQQIEAKRVARWNLFGNLLLIFAVAVVAALAFHSGYQNSIKKDFDAYLRDERCMRWAVSMPPEMKEYCSKAGEAR